MKFGGNKYTASFAGQALDRDGNVINQERTPTMPVGQSVDKLLENCLKLSKEDMLDSLAIIVVTKEGEMQMAYRANNASILHMHAGRLMNEIEKDVFDAPQPKRTLLA